MVSTLRLGPFRKVLASRTVFNDSHIREMAQRGSALPTGSTRLSLDCAIERGSGTFKLHLDASQYQKL